MRYAPVPNGMDSTRRSVPSPRGRPRRGDDVSSSIPSTIFSSARTAASSSPFSHKNQANRSRSARALALISTRAIPHISSALASLSTTKPPAHRESLPLYADKPPTLPCPRASDAHTLLPRPDSVQALSGPDSAVICHAVHQALSDAASCSCSPSVPSSSRLQAWRSLLEVIIATFFIYSSTSYNLLQP